MRARVLSGAGNRFLVVDLWNGEESVDASALAIEHAREMDGVLSIMRSDTPGVGFRLRVHNRDGSLARMCGNGLRCAVRAARIWGRVLPVDLAVETDVGRLRVREGDEFPLECQVGRPKFTAVAIPTNLASAPRLALRQVLASADLEPGSLEAAKPLETAYALAVGGPHLVVLVGDLDAVPFDWIAPLLERHPEFPDRVNVHFAARRSDGYTVRTWERGAGPTAACGTGAAAVVIAGADLAPAAARVHSVGGCLSARWDGGEDAAWVGGPTEDEGSYNG